jgi:type II secretory pathway pseudopilin PulG
LTLTELLVVVAILVILMAVMIPALTASTKGRDVREAARELSSFLADAQSRAIELGRPVGVWFERDRNQPNASWRLFMAETPVPYSGDTYFARARIKYVTDNSNNPTGMFDAYLDSINSGLLLRKDFVGPGDLIRFGHRGPWYQIVMGPDPSGSDYYILRCRPLDRSLALNPVVQLPPPTIEPETFDQHFPKGLQYEILRRPKKLAMRTIVLTTQTAVDLYWSGTDDENQLTPFQPPTAAGTTQPDLAMMFDSQGRATEYLQYYPNPAANGERYLVARGEILGSVYFLVGRLVQTGLTNPEGKDNLTDQSSLWVSVSPRGLILTSENAGVPGTAGTLNASDMVKYARQLAQPGRNLGGGA